MAIVETANLYRFRNAFIRMDRKENFSYEGLEILFDYLENLSDDIEKPIELDVIAICCDYSEGSVKEIIDNYDLDISPDDNDAMEQLLEYLNENTSVCGADEDKGIIVYANF